MKGVGQRLDAPTGQGGNPLWAGVWVLMAAQAGLLLLHLGRDSLWLDEMTSLSVVSGTLDGAIGFFKQFPEQHPLYYILLKPWMALGTSEAVLRGFSALTILLSTPLIYLVGRETLGGREARIATALSVFSPYLLYFGQEGRMYALLMLFTLVSTYLYLGWVRRPSVRLGVLYWLAATAAVYTHLFGVFVVIAHFCWVAASPLQRSRVKGAIALSGATALAYMPWLVFIITHRGAGQDWKSWVHVVFGLPYTVVRWTVGYTIVWPNAGWKDNVPSLMAADAPILVCAAIGFGWATVAGARRLFPSWRSEPGLILALLVVPPVLALTASPAAILMSERYLIVSFPAYVLLLSAGLAALQTSPARVVRSASPVLIALALAVAFWRYYRDPRSGKAEWRAVAGFVAARRVPTDAVVLHSSAVRNVFQHYAGGIPATTWTDRAADSVRGAPRIWLVVSHEIDGGRAIVSTLDPSHTVVLDSLFPKDVGIRVLLLSRRP